MTNRCKFASKKVFLFSTNLVLHGIIKHLCIILNKTIFYIKDLKSYFKASHLRKEIKTTFEMNEKAKKEFFKFENLRRIKRFKGVKSLKNKTLCLSKFKEIISDFNRENLFYESLKEEKSFWKGFYQNVEIFGVDYSFRIAYRKIFTK